jgi:hypothetical protein
MSIGGTRTDNITFVIPDDSGSNCPIGSTFITSSPNQGYPLGTYFISDKIQYFVQGTVPSAANIMDQWFNPTTGVLKEYITDGATQWWQSMNIETQVFGENLVVTGVNAVSNLSKVPLGIVQLIINSVATLVNTGPFPPFTAAAYGVIIFNPANMVYSINLGDTVIAIYDISIVVGEV